MVVAWVSDLDPDFTNNGFFFFLVPPHRVMYRWEEPEVQNRVLHFEEEPTFSTLFVFFRPAFHLFFFKSLVLLYSSLAFNAVCQRCRYIHCCHIISLGSSQWDTFWLPFLNGFILIPTCKTTFILKQREYIERCALVKWWRRNDTKFVWNSRSSGPMTRPNGGMAIAIDHSTLVYIQRNN